MTELFNEISTKYQENRAFGCSFVDFVEISNHAMAENWKLIMGWWIKPANFIGFISTGFCLAMFGGCAWLPFNVSNKKLCWEVADEEFVVNEWMFISVVRNSHHTPVSHPNFWTYYTWKTPTNTIGTFLASICSKLQYAVEFVSVLA